MNPPEFTPIEQMMLSGADFNTYDDPLAESLHDWETSAIAWNSRLNFVYRQAYSPDIIREGEAMLLHAQAQYIKQFTEALSAVAANSPVPELATKVIEDLVRGDDKQRCERLRDCDPYGTTQPMLDEHIRIIARAFGDPNGLLVIDSAPAGSQNRDATTYTATILYRQHLDRLSASIVGPLLDYDTAHIAEQGSRLRQLGTAGMRLIGRFKRA